MVYYFSVRPQGRSTIWAWSIIRAWSINRGNTVCSTDNRFSTMTNVTLVKSLGGHWIMAASLDRAQFLMKMLKFMTTAQEFGGRILQSSLSENYCAYNSQSRNLFWKVTFFRTLWYSNEKHWLRVKESSLAFPILKKTAHEKQRFISCYDAKTTKGWSSECASRRWHAHSFRSEKVETYDCSDVTSLRMTS